MKSTAIRTQVRDGELQAYMQRHPFLTGPDEDLNQRALVAVRAGIRVDESEQEVAIVCRPAAEWAMSGTRQETALAMLRAVGLSDLAAQRAAADFSWRVGRVPPEAGSILCLGCGTGEELAFLRAQAGAARILVLDYDAKVRDGLLKASGARFVQCDLVAELASLEEDFDVVFCNHTLEHLYEPDRVLSLIRRCLQRNGMLVAGLPLDGDARTPLFSEVVAMARRAERLQALDLGVFDAGHPWKTNAADLHTTLCRAGFGEVQLIQRADAPFRSAEGEDEPALVMSSGLLLGYKLLIAPLRGLMKALLGRTPPLAARRALVALERRLPFGAGLLKNLHSPDVVVTARAVPH
jgi:SAM-dependent methyltransferase